jgi:endonuclease III
MRERKLINSLLIEFGPCYSKKLGIALKTKRDEEIFKWFLASILFGAPISENSAIKTYNCFKKYNLLTPKRILETGWQGLVNVLDEGSYTRYDFKTADKLLEVMENLMKNYNGSLNQLHKEAINSRDLETRIMKLGKGIGEITTNIFLRELRGIWEKANPKLSRFTIIAARNLKLMKDESFSELVEKLRKNGIKADVRDFEAALLKLGKDFCRKNKCKVCKLRNFCERV